MQSKDNTRQAILLYLQDFEAKQNLKLIFVCQSGSRCHNTATLHSDHDLKGIYTSNKSKNIFKHTHGTFKGVKSQIDIEFIPKDLFLEEIGKEDCPYLRWILSSTVYIQHPQPFQQIIRESFNFPQGDIQDRISKDLSKVEVEGRRPAKKLLNMIVDSILLLYFKEMGRFPPMPIKELLQYVRQRPNLANYYQLLEQSITNIIIMKKNGKGLTQIDVPDEITQLARLALSSPNQHPMKSKAQVQKGVDKLRKVL